jgi:hypothetical protein
MFANAANNTVGCPMFMPGYCITRSSAGVMNSWTDHHETERAATHFVRPMVGTPAWCALDADDRVKLAALLDAAQHWALRIETAQEARCDGGKVVSVAADWSAVARNTRVREDFHASRPWMKREAA